MTELTITPKVSDKTARFKGTIAAGEHVAVTIKGGAEWIGTDGGANMTLRVLDLVTGRTLAVFPRPAETLEEGETPDAWSAATEDENDLYCELNLNTTRMVAAARHMLRVPVLFVLGDTDAPRTLYFRDRYEVEYWPERIGDTVPYDLDKWPKQIDEWTEMVVDWTARLNAMKLSAERTEATGSTPGKTTITLNDGTAQEDTVVDILDGQVTPAQMNAAIDAMGSTKQNTLTFDDTPTAESNNPVKSGGVKAAIDEVADAVTEHVGNEDIHVTAAQKTAWTAKYAKPGGGIPKSDLSAGVQASLALADTAVQVHQDISGKADKSDTYRKTETYSKDETNALVSGAVSGVFVVVASLPATGEANKIYLVPSEDAETGNVRDEYMWVNGAWELIGSTSVDLSNYYDKTAADGRFVQKETGKGLFSGSYNDLTDKPTIPAPVTVDTALSPTSENPVQNKAVVAALADKLDKSGGTMTGGLVVAVSNSNKAGIEIVNGQVMLSEVHQGGGSGVSVQNLLALVATIAGKANASDVATALAQKASLADLPYRLVELGKWEFSGVPTRWDITDISYELGDWTITYLVDGEEIDVISTQGAEDALSLTFAYSDEIQITATRPSLPGHLCDRAGNRVVVSGDTTLTLPAAVPGYLRDFLVRLEISGSTVPTITFAAPTGETITYETDGDEFPVPDEVGNWVYSFTENCVAHTFAVSLKKVNVVAQGGGS